MKFFRLNNFELKLKSEIFPQLRYEIFCIKMCVHTKHENTPIYMCVSVCVHVCVSYTQF